ncbi:MAG TPA: outer membrane lipoprotein-sorting protein [Spirochaetia bacterium]|nr:outer membrane lipoprotein-sorting protein [Spirochaetia bacterium]
MNNRKRFTFSALSIILSLGVMTYAQDSISALDIMRKVDTKALPKDITAKVTMNLIDTKGNVRERTLKQYRRSDTKLIMWFTSPADVKGTSMLRLSYNDRDDDTWIYLPAFGKVRRIASSAKTGSFMGSDFTYEDMETKKIDNYTYMLLRSEMIDDKDCYVIETTPKQDVTSDYSKSTVWIDKTSFYPVRSELYHKSGKLKKVMHASIKKHGQYWLPEKITMKDARTQHTTVMISENIIVDTELSDALFKTTEMTRIR